MSGQRSSRLAAADRIEQCTHDVTCAWHSGSAIGPVSPSPDRLVVRTSRCGRDNPGSTPGQDNVWHLRGVKVTTSMDGDGWRGLCWCHVSDAARARMPQGILMTAPTTLVLWACLLQSGRHPPKIYRFFKWTAFLDLWGTQNHKLEAQNQTQQSQPNLINMVLSAGNWHHPGTLGP